MEQEEKGNSGVQGGEKEAMGWHECPHCRIGGWSFCASHTTNLTTFNSWMLAVVGVTMQGGDSAVRVKVSSTLCVYSETAEEREAVYVWYTHTHRNTALIVHYTIAHPRYPEVGELQGSSPSSAEAPSGGFTSLHPLDMLVGIGW